MKAECHCGAVRMEVAHAPANVYDCNCSICRRLGVLWAYYRADQVRQVSGADATFVYQWGNRGLEFHTCRTCGCTTHWQPAVDPESAPKMGINARLMDALDRTAVHVGRIDGAKTGVFWPASTPGPHDPE